MKKGAKSCKILGGSRNPEVLTFLVHVLKSFFTVYLYNENRSHIQHLTKELLFTPATSPQNDDVLTCEPMHRIQSTRHDKARQIKRKFAVDF